MSAVDRVVARIKERAGGGGIKGLQRVIAIMDDDGNKRLSKEELKTGLKDYGVELNIRELDDIFALFDRDRDGTIDVTEFLVAIKGPLNDRRKRLVKMAFDILDTDGSGEITINELAEKYDVSAHPGVKAGKITERQALEEFMSQWDRLDKDNLVTLEEFEDYYRDISASIDGDDYFELMIRNAWRIAGGKGAAANTANRRVLVTNKDGSQSIVGIDNELGLKADDREGMRRRLAAQGVHAENIELYGGMDTTEKPKKVIDCCVGVIFAHTKRLFFNRGELRLDSAMPRLLVQHQLLWLEEFHSVDLHRGTTILVVVTRTCHRNL